MAKRFSHELRVEPAPEALRRFTQPINSVDQLSEKQRRRWAIA